MEIKRNFEIVIATNRRYVIRQYTPGKEIVCAKCGEAMLTTEQSANFFGIKQRRVFQIIETDAAHFTEAEAGATLVCLASLAAVLDGELRGSTV